mmetsp:Transcript_15902/g.24798  ORF Transcript_15902/g.24798 Transcript_15902/m.24798 type:complete len:105 (+) Transcript_15902:284-598(+)
MHTFPNKSKQTLTILGELRTSLEKTERERGDLGGEEREGKRREMVGRREEGEGVGVVTRRIEGGGVVGVGVGRGVGVGVDVEGWVDDVEDSDGVDGCVGVVCLG